MPLSHISRHSLFVESFISLARISDYEHERVLWKYSRGRCPGTTKWLLDKEEFKAWINHHQTCLWLTGKVGSGKTFITSTIVEHLTSLSQSDGHLVAHYFYTRTQKNRLTALDLFSSYIKQGLELLDSMQKEYPSDLVSSLNRLYGHNTTPAILDEIIEFLFFPLNNIYQGATYIVDGLDECETKEAQKALSIFRKLRSQHNDIRILISGRESLDILNCIPNSAKIQLSFKDVEGDISKFIEWKIEEKMCDRHITEDESLLQTIKDTLNKKADCMLVIFRR
jgi:hypothetical protein